MGYRCCVETCGAEAHVHGDVVASPQTRGNTRLRESEWKHGGVWIETTGVYFGDTIGVHLRRLS
jgi:hypothetical protein